MIDLKTDRISKMIIDRSVESLKNIGYRLTEHPLPPTSPDQFFVPQIRLFSHRFTGNNSCSAFILAAPDPEHHRKSTRRSLRIAVETPRMDAAICEGRVLASADLYAAVIEGAVERVRPKMMTVVAIMAGLLPIMWGTGTGSEVMSRIAAPMVGGMISSTVLTLGVIPALYALVKQWQLRRESVAPAAAAIASVDNP